MVKAVSPNYRIPQLASYLILLSVASSFFLFQCLRTNWIKVELIADLSFLKVTEHQRSAIICRRRWRHDDVTMIGHQGWTRLADATPQTQKMLSMDSGCHQDEEKWWKVQKEHYWWHSVMKVQILLLKEQLSRNDRFQKLLLRHSEWLHR